MCIHIYIYIYVCIYLSIYIYTYVYIFMYVFMFLCMYTYIMLLSRLERSGSNVYAPCDEPAPAQRWFRTFRM